MTKQEIENHADRFMKAFCKFPLSDVNCLSCKSPNCPYNRECHKCGKSFAFYAKGNEDGNKDWFLTISICEQS